MKLSKALAAGLVVGGFQLLVFSVAYYSSPTLEGWLWAIIGVFLTLDVCLLNELFGEKFPREMSYVVFATGCLLVLMQFIANLAASAIYLSPSSPTCVAYNATNSNTTLPTNATCISVSANVAFLSAIFAIGAIMIIFLTGWFWRDEYSVDETEPFCYGIAMVAVVIGYNVWFNMSNFQWPTITWTPAGLIAVIGVGCIVCGIAAAFYHDAHKYDVPENKAHA